MELILRKGNNMKKRFLSLALVMVMIFTLLPINAFAESNEQQIYGICLTGLENNYEKNDVESKDLTSFFFYLKTIEITEVLP